MRINSYHLYKTETLRIKILNMGYRHCCRFLVIRSLPVPVIAAINGPAVGKTKTIHPLLAERFTCQINNKLFFPALMFKIGKWEIVVIFSLKTYKNRPWYQGKTDIFKCKRMDFHPTYLQLISRIWNQNPFLLIYGDSGICIEKFWNKNSETKKNYAISVPY